MFALQHRSDALDKVAGQVQKPFEKNSQNMHSPFLYAFCLPLSQNSSTLQG
jgi:hypothetical protein